MILRNKLSGVVIDIDLYEESDLFFIDSIGRSFNKSIWLSDDFKKEVK